MRRLPRPQTAPSTKRAPQEERPIVRLATHPLREEVAAHGCNSGTVIASIKGDIVMLQRRIDGLKQQQQSHPTATAVTPNISSEMEHVEKILLGLNPAAGDEHAANETQVKLLELLVQRINALSHESLRAIGEDPQALAQSAQTAATATSRTSGVCLLMSFVQSLAQRKRLWESAESANPNGASAASMPSFAAAPQGFGFASSQVPTTESGMQTMPPPPQQQQGRFGSPNRMLSGGALEDAMNEPTVSQLRALIAEQRQLQNNVKDALALSRQNQNQQQTQHHQPPPSAQQTPGGSNLKPDNHHHQEVVSALKHEIADWKKKCHALEQELKLATDASRREEQEQLLHDFESARTKAASVAFCQALDVSVMAAAGIEDPSKAMLLPSGSECDAVTAKIQSIIAEAHANAHPTTEHNLSASGATGTQKPKSGVRVGRIGGGGGNSANDSQQQGGPGATEGALWTILHQQNTFLRAFTAHIKSLDSLLKDAQAKTVSETSRLQRVVQGLDERVRALKDAATREAEKCRSELAAEKSRNDALQQSIRQQATATAQQGSRIVHSSKQPLSGEARAKALAREVQLKEQCILDLKKNIDELKDRQMALERSGGLANRDRSGLVGKLEEAVRDKQALTEQLDDHSAELQSVRKQLISCKKELREKTTAEAEVQQSVWKLEVELHIAQNVINELRLREDQQTREIVEARECQKLMTAALERERGEHAKELTKFQHALRAAKSEEAVARQVLTNERTKMIENEKEVDRLRSLDLKMDILEQNFTNYAACKLVQRAAVEDEEQALQECVDAIGKDVFNLPADLDSEENVQLLLTQLKAKKDAFDAEERMRKRHKATMVNFKDDRSGRKQLTTVMKMRYNAIQIFSCEQRLRQMALERSNRKCQTEMTEYKAKLDNVLVELSHAKMQCDSLVQRNTELEVQRKELMKNRATGEQEIKNLKTTIHKMRVVNEEQEKMLVEVGTSLQQARIHDGAPAAKVVTE